MSRISQIVAVALSVCSGSAFASEICGSLRFELATLASHTARNSDVSAMKDAIVSQETEIEAIESGLTDSGCNQGSLAVIGREQGEKCSMLAEKKIRMERNLRMLEDQLASLNADMSAREAARREDIGRALDQNGCSEATPLVGTPGEDSTPLVGDGTTETVTNPGGSPFDNEIAPADQSNISGNGYFQTICVRTCDGGFFPISSHASPLDFRRDAQICSQMCPGIGTELYFQGIEQERAEMRSTATGRPYSEMTRAFGFKKTDHSQQCGCNFSSYYKEMARLSRGRPLKEPAKDATSIRVVKSAARTDASLPKQKIVQATRDYIPDPHMRRVGPEFLPDESSTSTAQIADK